VLPRWTLLSYANKVVYSDFIGVDDWPGSGKFSGHLRAPHRSEGYNRLFGDGSVFWVGDAAVDSVRPVDATPPTHEELYQYYQQLDVLP
jgi:hypothetical protein